MMNTDERLEHAIDCVMFSVRRTADARRCRWKAAERLPIEHKRLAKLGRRLANALADKLGFSEEIVIDNDTEDGDIQQSK